MPPKLNGTWKYFWSSAGIMQTTDRYSAPANVMRDSTRSMYCAVFLPGTNARDEAAALLQVVRDVDRVEHDRRVEEREEHDEDREDQVVAPVRRMKDRARTPASSREPDMFAICAGNMRIDDAKIGGMTPETLILSGR